MSLVSPPGLRKKTSLSGIRSEVILQDIHTALKPCQTTYTRSEVTVAYTQTQLSVLERTHIHALWNRVVDPDGGGKVSVLSSGYTCPMLWSPTAADMLQTPGRFKALIDYFFPSFA